MAAEPFAPSEPKAVNERSPKLPAPAPTPARLPDATERAVQGTVDGGNGGQPHLRSLLTFDAASGTLLRREAFTDQGPGRRARALLRFAHTGEVFGVVGQTVAGLVSLGSLVLVYTGVALSWRRWRRWRARAGEPRAAA